MIHQWKGLDLEITALTITKIRHPQMKLFLLKPQGTFYVDFILLCETKSSFPRAERVKKAKLEELSN